MTNAILFNKMRGSGRDVTINLIDAGIEITSAAGEHIAVWPYPVVDLIKETGLAHEGYFAADHDETNLLRVFDRSMWDRIVEHTPRAQETEASLAHNWRRDLLAFDIHVWAAIAGLIVVGCSYAFHAIFSN